MIIYTILTYSEEGLEEMRTLWGQWYELCSIYDWKIFLKKNEKKIVKSRALTIGGNKSIDFLRSQREKIDNGEQLTIPSFITNEKEWLSFIDYWTQKNTGEWKMHCEKQKTFEIRARWAFWIRWKDTKIHKNKANTIW